MKFETIGSASAGSAAVAGTWLMQAGTSWPVVIAALAGAVLAVLEMEDLRLRLAMVIFGFNGFVGALGGPVIVAGLQAWFDFSHPAVAALVAFVAAFVAHDLLGEVKHAIVDRFAKRGTGK